MTVLRTLPAALALVAGFGIAVTASAQVQSWNGPMSIGPFSGTGSFNENLTPQGVTGSFGYAGSGAERGYNGSVVDTGSWSVNRGGFNDTLGVGGSVAGNGMSASGLGLEAGSFTPNGGSISYGAGGSLAGNGMSASGLQTGGQIVTPSGSSRADSQGASAAANGMTGSSGDLDAGASTPRSRGFPRAPAGGIPGAAGRR